MAMALQNCFYIVPFNDGSERHRVFDNHMTKWIKFRVPIHLTHVTKGGNMCHHNGAESYYAARAFRGVLRV